MCCSRGAGPSAGLQRAADGGTAEAEFNSRSAEAVTGAAAQRSGVPPGFLVGQAQLPAGPPGERWQGHFPGQVWMSPAWAHRMGGK